MVFIFFSFFQVVYFTATFPYVLLTILLFRAVTLENASEGLLFYLKPNMTRLSDAAVSFFSSLKIIFIWHEWYQNRYEQYQNRQSETKTRLRDKNEGKDWLNNITTTVHFSYLVYHFPRDKDALAGPPPP